VRRAKDRSDVRGFENFDNSTCERVLNLLEAGYLRIRKVVDVKRITVIKFEVNDRDDSGTSCCRIEVMADTDKLANMIIAGFGAR